MSKLDPLFSSDRTDWETPQALFDVLNQEFNFGTDVCANPDNYKCTYFYTESVDGLLQPWEGVCWMNPPYGRGTIDKWMDKAYNEATKHGNVVVCLVPARTDTKWWHNYAMKGEVRFIKGRLKFVGAKTGAPFPSAIVIFGNGKEGQMSSMERP